MKTLSTIFGTVLLITTILSCSTPKVDPEELGQSSYEFRFLSGPLQGKEFKASGLTREQVTSLYAEYESENLKGVSLHITSEAMTIASSLNLNSSNQLLPFSSDTDGSGTQMYLSFSDNGTAYSYGAVAGNPQIHNLKIARAGAGAAIGLTTFELTFDNATFADQVAAGNNENEVARVSGKIIVK